MDFTRPIEVVIPGARGRLLGVLARTDGDLNLRTVASLANVSVGQASRVMPDLVELGMVERREVPPSALFRLVRHHVAVEPLLQLERARDRVVEEMAHEAKEMRCPPESVIVFGSFSRGDGDALSDIDVVLVRSPGVDDDDPTWLDDQAAWRRRVSALAGNRVEILDVGLADVKAALESDQPLWADLRNEGRVVFGSDFGVIRRANNG